MLGTRLIFLASGLCASSAVANTPPIPPPEPARLAAAEQLVAAFPLENAFASFNAQGITSEVANNALAWLAAQPPQDRKETVKQIFYEKVRNESRSRLAAAIGDARKALAERYARRLSERDLNSAQSFAATPEGTAFLEVQLDADTELRNLVSRFLFDRMFPELPRILQSARDTGKVLERINQKR
jgi:hypothetical protein